MTERTLERARVVSQPQHNLFYLWFIPENTGVELARLCDRKDTRAARVVSRPHHNLFYLWFIPENAGVELARLCDRKDTRAR